MSEDNIRLMPRVTDPDVILQKAQKWGLKTVVVIGWDSNSEFRIGGNNTSLQEIAWLLKNADQWLVEAMFK